MRIRDIIWICLITGLVSYQSVWASELDCKDLIDNDQDGLTDCQDPDCPKVEEVCDGFDNDCNKLVDDELEAPLCELTRGVCKGKKKLCKGKLGWSECDASIYGSGYEEKETRCDGIDNDCDGQKDEDLEGPFCRLQLGIC